jgi:lipoate-protein ligase A
LTTSGERVELATEKALSAQLGGNICFASPVRADVLLDGRKIAGAAQRRTRRGLLQQGSIQNVNLGNGLGERFARALSSKMDRREIDEAIVCRAREIARQKYGSEAWLRKR